MPLPPPRPRPLPTPRTMLVRVVGALNTRRTETAPGPIYDELSAVMFALVRGELALVTAQDVRDVVHAALYGENTEQAEHAAARLDAQLAAHREKEGAA